MREQRICTRRDVCDDAVLCPNNGIATNGIDHRGRTKRNHRIARAGSRIGRQGHSRTVRNTLDRRAGWDIDAGNGCPNVGGSESGRAGSEGGRAAGCNGISYGPAFRIADNGAGRGRPDRWRRPHVAADVVRDNASDRFQVAGRSDDVGTPHIAAEIIDDANLLHLRAEEIVSRAKALLEGDRRKGHGGQDKCSGRDRHEEFRYGESSCRVKMLAFHFLVPAETIVSLCSLLDLPPKVSVQV